MYRYRTWIKRYVWAGLSKLPFLPEGDFYAPDYTPNHSLHSDNLRSIPERLASIIALSRANMPITR